MREKIPSEITQLALSDASYEGCGVSITPTLINFFFGNNGTGKSTVARTIKANSGITWKAGRSSTDYVVHVYNQEYINANFQNYYQLPGVFTVNEVNIAIQQQADEKNAARKAAVEASEKAHIELGKKLDAKRQAFDLFQKECWDKTADIRQAFDKTQERRKTKKAFAEAVLEIKVPAEHDLDVLHRLYSAAYSDDAKKYDEFATVADVSVLDSLQGSQILSQKIVSSADTPFAQFIKAMNATTWVQQGHTQYHQSGNGKCPYCQQKLPETFEDDIRACFDIQYTDAIDDLNRFFADYRNTANALIVPLQSVPTELLPGTDVTGYNDKLAAIKGIISSNLHKITEKMADPTLVVELDNVAPMLQELSDIIESFNKLIRENNAVISQKPKKQAECKTAVWEHIAFMLADIVARYQASETALNAETQAANTEIGNQETLVSKLDSEISELSKDYVNTKATIDSVNMLLRDSGFQGFSIREKEHTPHVYEVVRPNGSIAENLSEGERNFIAFLYFYHQVKGSETADGIQRDRIVVIDDPVSSMDSSALFIVSALVREMVEICENNAIGGDPVAKSNHIKQIFILTHNAYFHREITYNRVRNYQYVNFYLISKVENRSTIKCCTKTNPDVLTEEINYNPVQNSYAALWEEYRELNAPIPLMNVIRRILEYYFLQLCGYDGVTLRGRILTDNKDKFIKVDETGKEDYTQYQMAHAMLSYINANSVGLNDGINFVDDCVDVEQTKETFRMIFTLMEQKQHYDMMMGHQ